MKIEKFEKVSVLSKDMDMESKDSGRQIYKKGNGGGKIRDKNGQTSGNCNGVFFFLTPKCLEKSAKLHKKKSTKIPLAQVSQIRPWRGKWGGNWFLCL